MRFSAVTFLMGVSTVGLLAASPTLATDLMSPIEDMPMMSSGAMPVGYIELNVGASMGQADHSDSDDWTSEWNEVDIGASGRVAIPVADPLILQLDASALGYRGSYRECDADGNYCNDWSDYSGAGFGLAAHLAYKMDGGLIGGMVSFGGGADSGSDFDGSVALALEAAKDMGNFRLYGQVGLVKAVTGYHADIGSSDVFAQGVLAYYIDPNFVLSANAGVEHWMDDYYDESGNQFTWGLRLEKKIDGTPASVYVAYQGWAWSGSGYDPDYYVNHSFDETEHAILAGIRFAFGDDGSSTLQDLNNAVGLVDMNPIFGDLPH
jgi:hypothetical protein